VERKESHNQVTVGSSIGSLLSVTLTSTQASRLSLQKLKMCCLRDVEQAFKALNIRHCDELWVFVSYFFVGGTENEHQAFKGSKTKVCLGM
jgi:hypothetical protein